MRLLQPQQMMAESRHVVDEAYAGDIIGVFDPGIFPSEIQSVHLVKSLHSKVFLHLHRNILRESVRLIL